MFTGNTARSYGGAIWRNGAEVSITNCTVAGNTAGIQFAGIHNMAGDPLVLPNSVVWGNSDGNGTGQSAQIGPDLIPSDWQIDYCCIQGWDGSLGGTGNVGTDPLFEDPDGADNIVGTPDDDLSLAVGSPVIDAADNDAVPFDLGNLDGDGHIYEITPQDRRGKPRFVDDPSTNDTGNGTTAIVDMGAFELQCDRSPAWICDGDVDGNGQVNPADLGLVQAAFGSTAHQDLCSYDLDCNGQINPVDSGIVQSLFGTCNAPRSACP